MPREWLPVIGGFVGGVLVMVARGWLTKVVEALGRRLQQRFAGSRMLHRRSLGTYRARVLADQETFRPAFAPDIKLSMREVYVPLRVAAQGREAGEDAQTYEAVRGVRCAVVTGPPGSGKSMLLRHSMLLWASVPRRRRSRSGRVPVLVELHRTNTGDGSIRDHIVQVLNGQGFANSARFVDRALEAGGIEVFLDGLDEVSTERRSGVIDLIGEFAERYRGCRVVLTCRSAVYSGELSVQFPHVFQIGEFDERLIRRFLRAWPHLPDETAIDALMAVLHEAPRIRRLAGNPLLLTMIAYLFGRNYGSPNQVLPHSRAEFYRLIIDTLLDLDILCNRQNRYPERVKRRALERLALAGLDTTGSGNRLELLRTTVRAELSQLWPDLDLPPEADLWSVVDELVERSGLLLAVDGGERFRFAHLTLQEYLAANALRAAPDALVERFRQDATVWREVVKLWCGSVDGDATVFLEKIRELDPILALECLADARTLGRDFAADLLGQYQQVIASEGMPVMDGRELTSVITVFGAVASDRRPRGAETFAFLERTLAGCGPQARNRAAAALAATNTPAAATVLAGAFTDLLAAREALVGMGDLAVHALAAIARDGSGDAVAALGRIGTPAAARTLIPLLWDVSEATSTLAAWQLAHLVASPDVESAILDIPLPPTAVTAPALLWIRASFAPEISAVAQVMARVAYLLQQDAAGPPPHRGPIDARLALPCILSDLPPVGYLVIGQHPDVWAAMVDTQEAHGRLLLPLAPLISGVETERSQLYRVFQLRRVLAAANEDARPAEPAETTQAAGSKETARTSGTTGAMESGRSDDEDEAVDVAQAWNLTGREAERPPSGLDTAYWRAAANAVGLSTPASRYRVPPAPPPDALRFGRVHAVLSPRGLVEVDGVVAAAWWQGEPPAPGRDACVLVQSRSDGAGWDAHPLGHGADGNARTAPPAGAEAVAAEVEEGEDVENVAAAAGTEAGR
ncbi:NACHT domain-containing NTPase [Frankia sp. Cj3]|uniref:NACHT domain-containing protein n=1 Tax=Frankia sp. Cj3 TaxID=2880976 RepID=UPI001EF486C5|nr:NACHT domain-containing protein [Frankia sp. Cj3]